MKFIRFWFPVLLYSGIIFTVSAIPGTNVPPLFPHFDKVVHLGEFGLWGWLMARAIWAYKAEISVKRLLYWVAVLTFLYGVSDEIHQYYVPGSKVDVFDLAADTLGGILGCLSFIQFNKHRGRKEGNYAKH